MPQSFPAGFRTFALNKLFFIGACSHVDKTRDLNKQEMEINVAELRKPEGVITPCFVYVYIKPGLCGAWLNTDGLNKKC